MPIFVIVMHALCNACWDLVLSRAAMLIKHVLCLVLSSSYGYYIVYFSNQPYKQETLSDFCVFIFFFQTRRKRNGINITNRKTIGETISFSAECH